MKHIKTLLFVGFTEPLFLRSSLGEKLQEDWRVGLWPCLPHSGHVPCGVHVPERGQPTWLTTFLEGAMLANQVAMLAKQGEVLLKHGELRAKQGEVLVKVGEVLVLV